MKTSAVESCGPGAITGITEKRTPDTARGRGSARLCLSQSLTKPFDANASTVVPKACHPNSRQASFTTAMESHTAPVLLCLGPSITPILETCMAIEDIFRASQPLMVATP